MQYIPDFLKKLIIIGANWAFRSMLFMDQTERLFGISMESFLILVLAILFSNYLDLMEFILLSFCLAHTICWIFNGHFFVLLKDLSLKRTDINSFIRYLYPLRSRFSKESSIAAIAAFGSLSRGELTENSDLDIRVIRRKGTVNGLRSCGCVFLERCRAFFNRFPLDIYVLDSAAKLLNLRKDEPPVILHDSYGMLQRMYHKTIELDACLLKLSRKAMNIKGYKHK